MVFNLQYTISVNVNSLSILKNNRSISGGSWIPRSIANSSQETANNLDFTRMKVGLLGDKLRRGRSERYLDLRVSLAALSAMGDPKSLPETFYLQQKDEMPV